MRKMVTFAKDWTTDTMSGTYTKKAGGRIGINGRDVYIDKNGAVVIEHFYGYGQAAVIPKEYFKNTA